MDELITIRKEQAVTSSLQVAEAFGKRHADVIRAIENLLLKLSEIDEANERKIALSGFAKKTYKDESGKTNIIYFMNRDAFSLLVMGFTGKSALEWKLKYIDAFNSMERLLVEKQTSAWIESRKQGKITRRNETDVIKELVEYAKSQGSTHSDMLYMTYTRLVNRTIGVKNRDNATILQINNLTLAEHIVLNTIRNGMAAGKTYKEIYQDSKTQLEAFSEIAFLPTLIKTEGA